MTAREICVARLWDIAQQLRFIGMRQGDVANLNLPQLAKYKSLQSDAPSSYDKWISVPARNIKMSRRGHARRDPAKRRLLQIQPLTTTPRRSTSSSSSTSTASSCPRPRTRTTPQPRTLSSSCRWTPSTRWTPSCCSHTFERFIDSLFYFVRVSVDADGDKLPLSYAFLQNTSYLHSAEPLSSPLLQPLAGCHFACSFWLSASCASHRLCRSHSIRVSRLLHNNCC